MKSCSVEGCARPHYGKGFCNLHYKRVRKYGSPDTVRKAPNGAGTVREDGYRIVYIDYVPHREHRLVWEREHGPIPEGFHIHHLNGDTLDNRLENLQLISASDHQRLHHAGKKRKPFSKQALANMSAGQKRRFAKARHG